MKWRIGPARRFRTDFVSDVAIALALPFPRSQDLMIEMDAAALECLAESRTAHVDLESSNSGVMPESAHGLKIRLIP